MFLVDNVFVFLMDIEAKFSIFNSQDFKLV